MYFEVDDEDTECMTKRDTTLPPLRKRATTKKGANQPQVVVGLALTRDGLPVRSWVFPGTWSTRRRSPNEGQPTGLETWAFHLRW